LPCRLQSNFIPIKNSIYAHSCPNDPSTSLKLGQALKNFPVVNVVSISRSSRTVSSSVEFNHTRTHTHTHTEFAPFASTPSWPRREPQSTAASGEIGLLFYFRKQFASVIKSFRATPAILRSQPDPQRTRSSTPSRPPSWFSSLFPSRECDASTRRRWALHLNFGFPGASREASATRESVIVSSFPKFQRRRDFSRVYWPLDLSARFHFRTI